MDVGLTKKFAGYISDEINIAVNRIYEYDDGDSDKEIGLAALTAVAFHLGTLKSLLAHKGLDSAIIEKLVESYLKEGDAHDKMHQVHFIQDVEHECKPSDGPLKEHIPEEQAA